MGFYLAFKEVWRNRGRFFLFSLVIALITTLVLFVAALSEGLALANKQYLEKLDAELIVFQKNIELSAPISQIGRSKLNNIRRVEGIEEAAGIGFSTAKIVGGGNGQSLDVSLIGIEAGKPGDPSVVAGRGIRSSGSAETVVDLKIARELALTVGDTIVIKTLQNAQEKLYSLLVIGITQELQYQYAPSIFVPVQKWDEIRPQGPPRSGNSELFTNVVAVQIKSGANWTEVASRIETEVADVEVVDIKTAYESIPGYQAQQNTLNTQQVFVLLIGVLVVGGFFQIQMLQKIPQIGVLKAIGASNTTVAIAAIVQIFLVSTFGVAFGGMVTLLLSLALPASVPIMFNGSSILIALAALLSIGPLGGLVTIRLAVRVEPLTALGLSS